MLEKDRPGKLFIGGLSLDITEDRLEKVFGKYGRITEVLLIRDKIHKQSRGFGFVTYENPQDALDACKGLNDTDLHGSTLHVTEAVVKVDSGMSGSPRRGGFSGRGRGGPPASSRRGSGGGYSSRGRGGPPMSRGREDSYEKRDSSYDRGGRDRSPIRKSPLLSSRGPPPHRDGAYGGRSDGPPPRRGPSDYSSRGLPASYRRDDPYSESRSSYPPARRDYRSPPRESRGGEGLLDDRLPPSRSYNRDPPASSRAPAYSSREPAYSSRAYPPKEYSPERSLARAPPRERSYPERNDYASSYPRDERKDTYPRASGARDYPPSKDYGRDAGPPPRDTYSSRESYPPPRRELSDSRDYNRSGGGYSSSPPPSKDTYRDSGGPKSYAVGSKSTYPSSRGPPYSSDRRGDDRNGYSSESRRSSGPPPSRGQPPSKRSRVDDRPPPRGRPPIRR